jgi:hypothetical protein
MKEVVADPPPKRPATEYWTLLSDLDGFQIVSIHVKRTYLLREDGACIAAPAQMPLMVRPLLNPEGEPVFHEGDVMPVKSGCDLVVMGTVFGRAGAKHTTASIAVGERRIEYCVHGTRRCSHHGPGTLRFSTPEPIGELPLRYENAYGGFDPTVVPQRPVENLLDILEHQPGAYPRNPVGKGYVVFENSERLDGLELPNIEHPQMLVSPYNLVLNGPEHWWRAPQPWSCDWLPRAWYPRCVFQGILPEYLPALDRDMFEVKAGWVEPNQRTRLEAEGPEWDHHVFSAASPALVLPAMRGDERVELVQMSKDGRVVVSLPGDRPRMQVQYAGQTHEVQPVLQRVLISTDEMGVSLLWQGSWRTPKELPEKQPYPGDDLRALLGIDVRVDEKRVEAAL